MAGIDTTVTAENPDLSKEINTLFDAKALLDLVSGNLFEIDNNTSRTAAIAAGIVQNVINQLDMVNLNYNLTPKA